MFFTSTLTFQVIISLLKPQEGSYPLYGTNRALWFNLFSTQFHKLTKFHFYDNLILGFFLSFVNSSTPIVLL